MDRHGKLSSFTKNDVDYNNICLFFSSRFGHKDGQTVIDKRTGASYAATH
jgi:hypothetical protein